MAKFKVGDIVCLKYSPQNKLFILEVQEQTCYGNLIQSWYSCRIFSTSRYSSSIGTQIHRFSEIELEENRTPSEQFKNALQDYKKLKAEKELLIKTQDFDKAAAIRDKEKGLKTYLEDLADAENLNINEFV